MAAEQKGGQGFALQNGWTDRDVVWELTHVGPSSHVLDAGQDRTSLLAAVRGNKSAMRPFTKLLWALASSCDYFRFA